MLSALKGPIEEQTRFCTLRIRIIPPNTPDAEKKTIGRTWRSHACEEQTIVVIPVMHTPMRIISGISGGMRSVVEETERRMEARKATVMFSRRAIG
jgi:hypothetical protein